MKNRKRVLGVNHPSTLTSMNNLAFTFMLKGKEGKAIKLTEEYVAKRKPPLGPDHPYTKNSKNTLNRWRIKAGLGFSK
jgi:hypothetical protein